MFQPARGGTCLVLVQFQIKNFFSLGARTSRPHWARSANELIAPN